VVSGVCAVVSVAVGFSAEGVNAVNSTGLVGRWACSLLGCNGVDWEAVCTGAPEAEEAMAYASEGGVC
jgi:hypothetical protein